MKALRCLLTTGALVITLAACGTEPSPSVSLAELQGNWVLSWTEAGQGLSCTWSGVWLALGDSTRVRRAWGGGQGDCSGTMADSGMSLVAAVVDTFTITGSRVRFVPNATSYDFRGTASPDAMSGTLESDLYYAGVGARIHMTGRWSAVRTPGP